jgi:hypothetical protein
MIQSMRPAGFHRVHLVRFLEGGTTEVLETFFESPAHAFVAILAYNNDDNCEGLLAPCRCDRVATFDPPADQIWPKCAVLKQEGEG